MARKSGKWILVGSLVSILMMGGLGLPMEKKAAKSEEPTLQEGVQTEAAAEVKESPAIVKGKKSQPAAEAKGESVKLEESKIVELKLIMEYKFDEPTIDVIFGKSEVTVKEARALGMKELERKRAEEKVKVLYPKVMDTKNVIKFLDKEGKVIKEIRKGREDSIDTYLPEQREEIKRWLAMKEFEETARTYDYTISPKGDIILETQEIYYATKNWGMSRFWNDMTKIYNIDGNYLGEIERERWPLFISPNEKYIVALNHTGGEVFTGEVYFYDINGNLLKEHNFKSEEAYGVDFSEDGNYAGILFGPSYIYRLFNIQGYLLWEYDFEGKTPYFISIHNSARYITWYTSDKLFSLIDKKGNLIWSLPNIEGDLVKCNLNKNILILFDVERTRERRVKGLDFAIVGYIINLQTGEIIDYIKNLPEGIEMWSIEEDEFIIKSRENHYYLYKITGKGVGK
ncbi:MAG: hypothetical protein AB1797_08850 [bacterium]